MKVIAWGTRGSIAVSNKESMRYGGNTTCFEVISNCLPKGNRLMIDAGTGFVPAGYKYLSEMGNGLKYHLLFTHWHYDHIMGLTLAPPTFIEQIPMELYGPIDEGEGPEEMVEHLFKRPYFPVDAKTIKHKMRFKKLGDFDAYVILIHSQGGFVTLKMDAYKSILKGAKRQFSIGGKSYPVEECMVVKMVKTYHGNSNCISYRFEETPTGKIFVLMTDHEDSVSMSMSTRNHLAGADLAIMDAQYDKMRYMTQTGGFGHGTPHGCIKHGVVCNVKKMGFTHHDPRSVDLFLEEKIYPEALAALGEIRTEGSLLEIYKTGEVVLTQDNIFLCYDYQEIEV